MDPLFCRGQEPPAPSLSRAGLFPSALEPPGAAPVPAALSSPPLRFGDEELQRSELGSVTLRLRPKEELGHSPGHCPGLSLPWGCSAASATALPPCCPARAGSDTPGAGRTGIQRWDPETESRDKIQTQNPDTGSRDGISSWAPLPSCSRLSRSLCPVCLLCQCPLFLCSCPAQRIAATSCKFSCWTENHGLEAVPASPWRQWLQGMVRSPCLASHR